eukprot:Hpha_TRINITY_DN12368_c0_g1::TRINITY_DN12368_c0_g1_i1::g.155901::m.155901
MARTQPPLLSAEAVSLPFERVPTPTCLGVPGAEPFDYFALKTKRHLQASNSGPPPGSTWIWFLVGSISAKPDADGEGHTLTLVGDKFQAGWIPESSKFVSGAQLRSRRQSMLRSVIDGKENAYGLERKGCPEGFRHDWDYADSELVLGVSRLATRGARWVEEKQSDRWTVRLTLTTKGDLPSEFEGGKEVVVVADQRAEKLNANQYATAMRGARFVVTSLEQKREVLEKVCQQYSPLPDKKVANVRTLDSFFTASPGTQPNRGFLPSTSKSPVASKTPQISQPETPSPSIRKGQSTKAPASVIDVEDLTQDSSEPPPPPSKRQRVSPEGCSAKAMVDLTLSDEE